MKKVIVIVLIVVVLFLGYHYSVRKDGASIIPRFWGEKEAVIQKGTESLDTKSESAVDFYRKVNSAAIATIINQALGTQSALNPLFTESIDLTGDGVPEGLFQEVDQLFIVTVGEGGRLSVLTEEKVGAPEPVVLRMVVQASGALEGYNLIPEAGGFYRYTLIKTASGYHCSDFALYTWNHGRNLFVRNDALKGAYQAKTCPS